MRPIWPWWRLCMMILGLLALSLSTIMSWHYLTGGQMVGCSTESPCEQVLSSRWSSIAGILPVSGLAMGAYLAILVALFYIGPDTELTIRRLAWGTILVLTGSVTGSAIWFTIVQKWFIGNFCPYCMATHINGLLLTALVIWRTIAGFGNDLNENSMSKKTLQSGLKNIILPLPAMARFLAGLLIAGIVVVCQISFKPDDHNGGESQTSLPTIDYRTAPIIGSPDAPYVVTVLFDYQCSHCQKLHFMLSEVVSHYKGKLAFVLCPAPLSPKCNPYIPAEVEAFKNSCDLARIGLTVWVANHEAFVAFESWMFSFETGDLWRPRSLESARAKAVELIGQDKFNNALSNPWITQYIQTSATIYGKTLQNGKSGVPKLIFGSRWVLPDAYDTNELITTLQQSLGVPKP